MFKETDRSNEKNQFFEYVQLQPLNYLVFSEKRVRGLSSNKTQILIKNISKKPIVYRVVQSKGNFVLKARPFIQLVLPKEQKKIEIFNDSDLVPTLNNRLIIEIVQYKQNIEEWSPKLFQENANLFAKDKESYEYKLYQTDLLNIVCYEYTLKQIENRICKIEDFVNKFQFNMVRCCHCIAVKVINYRELDDSDSESTNLRQKKDAFKIDYDLFSR